MGCHTLRTEALKRPVDGYSASCPPPDIPKDRKRRQRSPHGRREAFPINPATSRPSAFRHL